MHMKISKVSVTNLFGIFNHEINFNNEDRITIIYGTNGLGKTVILRMIDSLFNDKLSIFFRIPFDLFRVEFSDQTYVSLEKNNSDGAKKTKISFSSSSLTNSIILSRKDPQDVDIPLRMIEDVLPELTRINPSQWKHTKTNQFFMLEDIFDQYEDVIELRIGRTLQKSSVKKHLPSIQTHIIKADRLRTLSLVENDWLQQSMQPRRILDSSGPAVLEYSQDLVRRVQKTLAESAEFSSSLDRSFPMRLADTLEDGQQKVTDEQIRTELEYLEKKRVRLFNAGLLDQESGEFKLPQREVNESTRLVLNIYIQDVKKKLAIFDDDLKRIELMTDILRRRLEYKYFKVAKNQGFVVTTASGIELSPDSLSSGEQHEIVVLYELLFRVKEKTLILLDEPEISLHIAWQQEFLKDLTAIIDISDLDVMIATHSPDIINDRWDLTVQLKGPEKQDEWGD